LKKLKQKYIDELDVFGKYEIYVCLANYCINRANEGFTEYRKERFELDKEILDKNINRLTAFISLYYFLTVVTNACRLKEFGWAEGFIGKYKDRLDPQHRDYAVNYTRAEICFFKCEYDEALFHLSRISTELSQQKQQVRNLLLRIYYETGSFEEALYLIDSSKHFLTRTEGMPENTKVSYNYFVRFLHELVKIRLNREEDLLIQLKNKLSQQAYFTHKEWLIEKAKDLERS
jgi:hypothetical protein